MNCHEAVYAAAEAIAGEPPPPWLVETVGMAVQAIRGNNDARANFPTRKALQDRLNNVRQGALLLAREFNEFSYRDEGRWALIAFLTAAGLGQETINALRLAVPKLAECVKSAVPVRKGKGRDKTFPNPKALSPHVQCAALVAWGWQTLRGTRPPHTSEKVHEACEAVWKATGLPRAHFGNSLTGWRMHLETIDRDLEKLSPTAEAGWSFRQFWDGLTDMADLHRKEGNLATKPQAK